MTIPNQPTQFRKREVLKSAKLNQALGEYGSQGGVIPYNENGVGDTSHSLPLGTKQNPFGNAFFKGMNIYTQLEVQQLVEAGKLTQTDRFVFWNLTTNTLCAWNGTEIVTLQGSDTSMEYLFGDGSDGDVTMVAGGSYSTMKNFKNFTLNAGVTLSVPQMTPLILRCTGTCTINGTISATGAGWPAASGHGYTGLSPYLAGSPGESANEGRIYAKFLSLDFTPIFGSGGGASAQSGAVGINGGGAGGAAAGSVGKSGAGGAGGGMVLIIARQIIVSGGIYANGAAGQSTSGSNNAAYRASCGGGGAGGVIALIGNEITVNGTINVAGGAGGSGSYSNAGNAGGSGCYVHFVI